MNLIDTELPPLFEELFQGLTEGGENSGYDEDSNDFLAFDYSVSNAMTTYEFESKEWCEKRKEKPFEAEEPGCKRVKTEYAGEVSLDSSTSTCGVFTEFSECSDCFSDPGLLDDLLSPHEPKKIKPAPLTYETLSSGVVKVSGMQTVKTETPSSSEWSVKEKAICLGNEIRLTFHVRSSRTAKNWDMRHSIASFHNKSKIGKFRKCLLVSSSEIFKNVSIQLVDKEGTQIPQLQHPLFLLCAFDGGETGSSSLVFSHTQKVEFYIEVHHSKENSEYANAMFLRIETVTSSSKFMETIPLVSAGHKYPYGKKQASRLAMIRQALVAKGGATEFTLQEFPVEPLLLSLCC